MDFKCINAALLVICWPTLVAADCCSWKKYDQSRFAYKDERKVAYNRRESAACLRTLMQKYNDLEDENNGDEQNVPDFAAQFSKTLEHDPMTGILTPNGQESYKTLVKALRNGSQNEFNSIQRAPGATIKLANPQGALTFTLEGADSSSFKMKKFPRLATDEAAALLIEDYLMALCRDVNFNDYGTGTGTDATTVATGSLTNNTAAILQDLGPAYTGPRNGSGVVDSTVLFRCNSAGCLIGPYISQFLLVPIPVNIGPGIGGQNLSPAPFVFNNQQMAIASSREFGVSFADFVAIENGTVPQPYQASDYDAVNTRFIIDGRDGASYVHFDNPCQACYNTLMILFANHFPYSAASPYSNGTITNESAFVSFGICDAFGFVGAAMDAAARAAWAQKWRAQRALRPEAFAGLVHVAKTSGINEYNLSKSFFLPHAGIDLLELILEKNVAQGAPTYLLSQVYPEGSPTHPSYPAAHAVIGGAGITIIKALFEDTVLLNTIFAPVKPDPTNPTKLVPLANEGEAQMTLGSELDKLSANVCMFRDFAGIHYRGDGEEGMMLGEQVAIKFLQDHASTITEQTFQGYELTMMSGQRIRITATNVELI